MAGVAAAMGDAIVPANVLGARAWIQHAWFWDDIAPSAAVVARFKAAHAPAALAAGLTAAQVAHEAALFDTPAIWRSHRSLRSLRPPRRWRTCCSSR